MKKRISVLMLALTSCYADSTVEGAVVDALMQEENVGEAMEALTAEKREPTVVGIVRTPLDVLPEWEVYKVSPGYWLDDPIVVTPKTGRGAGRPIILWFGYYRVHGERYFEELVHSGYLDALDLRVIAYEMTRKSLEVRKRMPKDGADPFREVFELGIDPIESQRQHPVLRRHPRMEEGVSVPPNASGGPIFTDGPTSYGPVNMTPADAPTYSCSGTGAQGGTGGAPVMVADLTDCPDYADELGGATKVYRAIVNWLPHSWKDVFGTKPACQKACLAPATATGAADIACNVVPALRVAPQTATPCRVADISTKALGAAGAWCLLWCDDVFAEVK